MNMRVLAPWTIVGRKCCHGRRLRSVEKVVYPNDYDENIGAPGCTTVSAVLENNIEEFARMHHSTKLSQVKQEFRGRDIALVQPGVLEQVWLDCPSTNQDDWEHPDMDLYSDPRYKPYFQNALLDLELADLEYELAVCQGRYDPDELASLMTAFFELMVTMAHEEWDVDQISYYPKTGVDLDFARSLGYSESSLRIMAYVPSLNTELLNEGKNQIYPDSRFMRYTTHEDLRKGRKPPLGDEFSEELDEWVLPLVYPINGEGVSVALDTRLGVVRVWYQIDNVVDHIPEYNRGQRYHPVSYTDLGMDVYPHKYRYARCVPAAKYFKTLIQTFKDLRRLPNTHPNHATKVSLSVNSSKESLNSHTVEKLYRQCGWPENFDRAGFKEVLEEWKEELQCMDKEDIREFIRTG